MQAHGFSLGLKQTKSHIISCSEGEIATFSDILESREPTENSLHILFCLSGSGTMLKQKVNLEDFSENCGSLLTVNVNRSD